LSQLCFRGRGRLNPDRSWIQQQKRADLIALGFRPGPKFGEILEAVETRQIEGCLRTREEALEWIKREYSSAR
jgi:hypothetical protein